MSSTEDSTPRIAIVTGAAGQDGTILVQRLLDEGSRVHAIARDPAKMSSPRGASALQVHALDLVDVERLQRLIAKVQPDEVYNLGGVSSVAASFDDPWTTWETNARPVVAMLQAIRDSSPNTRFYQASSSEMFGSRPGGSVLHDETSPLSPQSPYAAAKAAAHLACADFRRAFGVRVACGITFNHESSRRPAAFLSRKVVDHVRRLQTSSVVERQDAYPLVAGNLAARRDWGFAPDYVDGMIRISRQIETRAAVAGGPREGDSSSAYHDYVLATGQTAAVWQLVDRAFALGGFALDWSMEGEDVAGWSACFRGTSSAAVVVDPSLLRPTDPAEIAGDSRLAREELGWRPRVGLDTFLIEMLRGLG